MVGFQYGSVVPGEDVSFTEFEFRAASLVGVPRLVFLLDEVARAPELVLIPTSVRWTAFASGCGTLA